MFNHCLDTFGLEPRLTTREVIHVLVEIAWHVIVGTHEGVVLAELVELDEEVVGGFTVEAGDVTAGENDACYTEGEDLVDGHFDVFVVGLGVTCPDAGVALGSKEE